MFRLMASILLCTIMLFAWRPAYADIAAAFTEVYADNGVPDGGRPATEGLHGLLGAGWFKGDRIVGDPRYRTVLLPIVLLTWKDWAYWSITGAACGCFPSKTCPFSSGPA